MKTSILVGTVGAVLLIVLGVAYFTLPHSSAPAQTATQTSDQTQTGSPAGTTSTSTPATSYTMAEVAQHNSASSCWTAINGKVYDVTSWISQHPGGPEHILPLCGTDGSAAFNGQHASQGQPADELATFYIGALSQ